MKVSWYCALLFAACTGDTVQTVSSGNQGDPEADPDEDPPVIQHEPVLTSQTYGEAVELSATVLDEESNVFLVEVWYKTETSTEWSTASLIPGPGDGIYEGKIPAADVSGGGMHYFLLAMDSAENEATDPEDGEADAFHFRVSE